MRNVENDAKLYKTNFLPFWFGILNYKKQRTVNVKNPAGEFVSNI